MHNEAERIEEFGGARSAIVAPYLEQVPMEPLEDIALIFGEGIPKYGERSWLKGVNNRAWKIERWKHALLHLCKWLTEGNLKENNLAKVGWFVFVMLKIDRIERGLGQDAPTPLMAYPPDYELRKADPTTDKAKTKGE